MALDETMKIGIDLTPLPPNPVGAGNYIIQLTRAITALPTNHRFVLFAQRHGKKLIGELDAERVDWVLLPDRSPSVRLVWEQIRLPSLVRQTGIDILHSLHYTRPRSLSCKSVVTFHDMTFFLFPQLHTRSKRLFFPRMMRLSARLAQALIADSESTRQDVISILDVPPEKITTIPLGINPIFRPIGEPGLLDQIRQKYHLPERFILYVGLIEPRKNVPLLLRAYGRAALSTDLPPLVLVGRTGWMMEPLDQIIASMRIKEQIHFTGYAPLEDLPGLYNLAEVFVYPSSYEGFGFPPLEAMACGTPVISSAVSALQENIGKAGKLVTPGDESSLAEALMELTHNPLLREELGRHGRHRAAEFTWERTAQDTLKVYERLFATG